MFDKILNFKFFVAALLLITVAITIQSYSGTKTFGESAKEYTHYNNYIIFKQSFYHLMNNRDLYQLYPEEHHDYYKYTPTFAFLMLPFAVWNDFIGLLGWNILNVFVLFIAFWKLPFQSQKIKLYAFAFILIELITSLQNSQSNALIAGIIILAFYFLENNKLLWASLLIVLSVFIKPFGIVAFALFLLYPNKIKSMAYTALWTLILGLLPLTVISFEQLFFLYKSWLHLLRNDHSSSYGLSVMGWLHSWFNIDFPKNSVVLIGAVIFCIPLLLYKKYGNLIFRIFVLASVLLWIVIFNHKAESPTFIIAVSGISIWFFMKEKKKENIVLLILVFIFSILSPTDLFPRSMRNNLVIPYVLKAVPCILIWGKLIYEMIFQIPNQEEIIDN